MSPADCNAFFLYESGAGDARNLRLRLASASKPTDAGRNAPAERHSGGVLS